ncbi:MAG: aspartate aminotransferase family protein [Gammaproteobacteria bacterium]
MTDALMRNYARLPVQFVRGSGAWLEDGAGRRYLDALSGIAVCALGHANAEVGAALADQAATLIHTSNLYEIPLQADLAAALCRVARMDRVFFCNSGAEANEAALKIARLHAHARSVDTPVVICAQGSFHGRTLGTLAATGNAKVQAGFEPLMPGFVHVPFGDIAAIAAAGDRQRNAVAVLVEPIQGEGGVQMPPAGYLSELRALCDARGWLMMLDEVQTGMCRTGAWFAWQHEDAAPDVMTLAKALGNGVPIGACLARGTAAGLFVPGKHGSTFGGNLLACRAALTVLGIMERDDVAARAAALGARMMAGLRELLEGHNIVREVRGKGCMIGIELAEPCGELVQRGIESGILINVTADRVIRLLPPLTLTDAEADQIVAKVGALVRGFAAGEGPRR